LFACLDSNPRCSLILVACFSAMTMLGALWARQMSVRSFLQSPEKCHAKLNPRPANTAFVCSTAN
jgi:hypothetical protein